MREHTAHYSNPLITWVLLANNKQVQIYDCHRTYVRIPLGGANPHHYYDEKSCRELTPVPNGLLESDSLDDYQLGHDKRGTTSSSNSPTHNTYEPHGDIKGEIKKRFAESIAHKLKMAYEEKLFDQLVLVASSKIISEVKKHLGLNIKDKVVATLPKDLSQYHGRQLMTQLRDTFAHANV